MDLGVHVTTPDESPNVAAASVINAHRRFRRRELGPFNLTVEPGETVILTGPNGSGKSTLLRLLLGLDKPSRGFCEVGGRGVGPTAPPVRSGFVPDRATFWDWRSATENLVPFCDHGQSKDLLSSVGLADVGQTPVRKFSRGMRQRLSIARGMANSPLLLVMDEPTIALDTSGLVMLVAIVGSRASTGLTTVIATHDATFLERVPAARRVQVADGVTIP